MTTPRTDPPELTPGVDPENPETHTVEVATHEPETAGDAHGIAAHGESPHHSDHTEEEVLHVDKYESLWIRISIVVLVIFFLGVTVSAFGQGFQLPGVYARVDPATLFDEGSPWADPQLRELAPGRYEVYVRGQIWSFTPNRIEVPAGSHVTFYATSTDVQHGVKIMGTNVNMMLLPGQVSTLSARFENPGTYDFVCHEYCGTLHHTMYGQIVVTEAPEEDAEADAVADAQ